MNNKHGLDAAYFRKNLKMLVRDVDNYTPEEMARALNRLSQAAVPKPALPDDVQRWRDWLLSLKKHTKSGHQKNCLQQSVYMLERLAQENAAREKAYSLRGEEIVLLQSKVEELESPVLPDDVSEAVNSLQNYCGATPAQQQKIAKLIKKFAQENAQLKNKAVQLRAKAMVEDEGW